MWKIFLVKVINLLSFVDLNSGLVILGFNLPLWLLVLSSLIVPFIITVVSIPTIVRVSGLKKLFDFPNERASHKTSTPNLGGMAIFSGVLISIMIFSLPADSVEIRYVAGALVILFFIGLKDDILVIDPKKKLLGQVLAALLIVILGDFRITNFHGIFSIGDISYIPSVLITVFLILSLINGFNLIDGVDGLSSGIGIVNSFFFGGWFLLIHEITLAVIAFSIAGSLSAYFIFNVFGKGNKIFMGDTGSMITGLIISVLVICFIQKENDFTTLVNFKSAPAFAFALVLLPLFDTLRIIVLRLLMGKSPFKADRNHIHHNLLKLGLSHLQITLLLTFATLVFVILVALLKHINSLLLIIMMLFLAALLTLWLDFSVKGKSDGNQL